ncbi:MAG: NAD-dependent succinate-semialdehyde dehydrogenase [Candidatus Krumholzibacteriia bacterium]
MRIETVNPATGEATGAYETMPPTEVVGVAATVREAQRDWREVPLPARAALFTRLAAVLRADLAAHARLITLEMGKPIVEARAEVEKCAWLCEVCAANAADWLREEEIAADGRRHRVVCEPLGVILAVMPWNFPFWQAFRFAVPALLAGNAGLLKHAANVPGCARAIEAAFRAAGFPPDLFRSVFADHDAVAGLVAGELTAGVSLTGSTAAGVRIGETAGRALKKVVLELGGSDPFIVLDDADVEVAAREAVRGRMLNAGQSCIAAKRFIVVAPLAAPFTARFGELAAHLVVGDPLDERTQVGPLVSADARREIAAQVAASLAAGARLVTGGRALDRPGFFYAPTVLAEVTPAMRAAREEVFGPVAPVLVARDEAAAIALANDTGFGLGASVWTRDLARGERVARRLEAGAVFVNSIVKSDPRLPFGGIKRSGLGRELAREGLREFVNVKGLSVYDHG